MVANANKLVLQITPTSIITTKGAGATAVTNTWDAAVPAMELLYGETYEARLVSPNHPLHLHIYPMQVGGSAHRTPTPVPQAPAQPQAPLLPCQPSARKPTHGLRYYFLSVDVWLQHESKQCLAPSPVASTGYHGLWHRVRHRRVLRHHFP